MKILNKNTIILIVFFTAIIVFVMGTISYAKYRFEIKAQITANYVGVRLSHNGDGQTAIMESVAGSTYGYQGYFYFTVENVLNDLISQRDIQYSVRLPNAEEISNGQADVLPSTRYYDMSIVDAAGKNMDTTSNEYKYLTNLVRDQHEKRNIYIRLDRKNTYNGTSVEALAGNMEQITLILDIVWPYKELRLFTVKVSDTMILITSKSEKYFEFNDQNVSVKTSNFYSYNAKETAYPIKLRIKLSNVIFDVKRFELENENYYYQISEDDIKAHKIGYCLIKDEDGKAMELIINIDMGSYFHLNFYTQADTIITCQAYFYGSDNVEENITHKIVGLTDGSDNMKKIYPAN